MGPAKGQASALAPLALTPSRQSVECSQRGAQTCVRSGRYRSPTSTHETSTFEPDGVLEHTPVDVNRATMPVYETCRYHPNLDMKMRSSCDLQAATPPTAPAPTLSAHHSLPYCAEGLITSILCSTTQSAAVQHASGAGKSPAAGHKHQRRDRHVDHVCYHKRFVVIRLADSPDSANLWSIPEHMSTSNFQARCSAPPACTWAMHTGTCARNDPPLHLSSFKVTCFRVDLVCTFDSAHFALVRGDVRRVRTPSFPLCMYHNSPLLCGLPRDQASYIR